MKTKLLSAVAAVPLLTIAHMGSAAEPLALSEAEMDIVTAGFAAAATADALANGNITFTDTFTTARVQKLTDSNSVRPEVVKLLSLSQREVPIVMQGNVDLFLSTALSASESVSQGLGKIPVPSFGSGNGGNGTPAS